VGDVVTALNGRVPRDILEWRQLADEGELAIDIDRGGLALAVDIDKRPGEPLGVEVQSALFDQVRTCDNHCEFCFIYQLPPGLRETLYLKDDDYRLSFLYGNFTTLTRFTEADLERVVTERLSPINVSIHATAPDVRAEMLRNRRGATSLRWLRALLDHGIEVHGQVVVCPGINDGAVLDDTMCGLLDEYPELSSACVVPLGVSRFNTEPRLRPHTRDEAIAVVDRVEGWQATFEMVLGRRLVFAADEYYLLAGRDFPAAVTYEGFPMHEDGVGMARAFERELFGEQLADVDDDEHLDVDRSTQGFFSWVEGTCATDPEYEPYRGPRGGERLQLRPSRHAPVAVVTSAYGARVLEPLLARLGRADVRALPVDNQFFGGTTSVTGLLVGEDIARVLTAEPEGHRYLLPDVCLSRGRFLDGTSPAELPRAVEIVATDGRALRAALDLS
jgi:putative radical SAM enzyme (TIGR03279 family)